MPHFTSWGLQERCVAMVMSGGVHVCPNLCSLCCTPWLLGKSGIYSTMCSVALLGSCAVGAGRIVSGPFCTALFCGLQLTWIRCKGDE